MGELDFLQLAARSSALRSSRSEKEVPLAALRKSCEEAPPPLPFRERLRRPAGAPIRIIAEIKPASPSRGRMVEDLDPALLAARYQEGGAAAISVLTEPAFFQGSLDHLRAAAGACSLPLLRKDFVVTDYQVWEARACGASAVLLIAALHNPSSLERRIALCRSLGMEALVEVSGEEEGDMALRAGASVIGANNRDLKTLELDMGRSRRILRGMPDGVVKVFESGYSRAEQVEEAERAGADAVLVGGALMAAADPAEELRRLSRISPTSREPARLDAEGRRPCF